MFKNTRINQFLTGWIISLGEFCMDCGLVWSATALPSLEETGQVGPLALEHKSWIGSLLAIGALVGCPLAGLLMNKFSRRSCLLIVSLLGFSGWIFLHSATSPSHLYAGRVITGISTAGYSVVVPIYIAEVASKENRGLLSSFFLIMACLGKLFSNVVGSLFESHFASLLCSIPSLLLCFLLFFIPESPNVLLRQGKDKEAIRALHWLNATGLTSPYFAYKVNVNDVMKLSPELSSKFEDIKQLVSSSTLTERSFKSTNPSYFSMELLKPVIIVQILMLLSQLNGNYVAFFYTVEIFSLAGATMISPNLSTIIISIIQTIGCLPCGILVDKYGRRPLLTFCFFSMALGMGGYTAYFCLKDVHSVLLEEYKILTMIPLASLVIYNVASAWGLGCIIWIVMSEILPQSIVDSASSFANATFWGSAFLVTQTFQRFQSHFTPHTWFLSFTAVCFLGGIYTAYFVPETKGLSLQEIQLKFKRKSRNDIPTHL